MLIFMLTWFEQNADKPQGDLRLNLDEGWLQTFLNEPNWQNLWAGCYPLSSSQIQILETELGQKLNSKAYDYYLEAIRVL